MSFQRRKVLAALKHHGFDVLREADGVRIAVPRHRELKRGTVRGIASDAGVEWPVFQKEIS